LYKVFSPADTIVHPDYRRKGIISKLNQLCVELIQNSDYGKPVIFINTSTSQDAMPLYLKQKWQKSNNKKNFYYKISLLQFNKSRENLNIFEEKSLKGCEIELSKTIKGKELANFSEHVRNINVWTNSRDPDFFNWKYSYQQSDYFFFYCRESSNLISYIIIKKLTGIQYSLEDYLSSDKNVFKNLIKYAIKKINIPILRCWAFTSEDKNMLRKAGFFTEPKILLIATNKKRFPFLIKPNVSDVEDCNFFIDGKDIRLTKNWQIQLADMH
jgi:hypothetical protein